MSRDQKSRAKARAARRSSGGVLLGIFIGLLLGAMIAAGAAWYFMHSIPVRAPEVQRPAQNAAPAPIALPGKPGDRPVEKPQFDFYKILPQGDAPAPEPARDKPAPKSSATEALAKAAPSVAPQPAVPVAGDKPDKVYLQVGAFEDPAEADNLKARLALMGFEASAQRAEIPDRGTIHRVRVGPYSKPDELSAVRAQLAQAGLNTTIVKQKP